MWTDEGLSLYRARQPLTAVTQNIITVDGIDTHDTNPPFYFLLLNGWRLAAGETIFALRFLGAAAGVLAIPLLFVMGRLLFDWRVGLAAALLMAISPFHIWEVQVLRNYGLLLTLNLLSIYGLWRFIYQPANRRQWRWPGLWLSAGLVGIYTHYFGFFIFAYGLVVLAVWLVWGWRRTSLSWLARQWWVWAGILVIALLLIPIIPLALARFLAGQQVDFQPVPYAKFVNNGLSAFAVGMSRSLTLPTWRVGPVVLLALVGLGISWWRSRRAAWLLLGYQIIPLGILLLLSLVNPLYNGTRHLLIGLPPFLLLTAVGMAGYRPTPVLRSQAISWLLLLWGGLVIINQGQWLHAQFTAPELVRDDVRGLAQFLSRMAHPDDRVVLHDTLIKFTFDYYYDGAAPVTAVPLYGITDTATAETALAEVAAAARLLWFVAEPVPRTGFPREHLPAWIRTQWPLAYAQSFPWMWLHNSVDLYVPEPVVPQLQADSTPVTAVWQGDLQLHGVAGLGTAVTSGTGWTPLFTWSRQSNTSDHYQLSLLFTDEQGGVWAEQNWALWRPYPADTWIDGELVQHPYLYAIPAGLPPGRYQLWAQLSDWETGLPVPLTSGEERLLLTSEITVLPNPQADTAYLPAHQAQIVSWPGIQLVGYSVETGPYRPGHLLPLDLYWQAKGNAPDSQLVVQLLDEAGQLAAETITTLTRPDYPPTQWQAGELVHGRAQLLIPAQAASGTYRLRLALRDPATGGWRRGQDGWRLWANHVTLPDEVSVEAWPLETVLPLMEQAVDARFGDPARARLAGVNGRQAALTPGNQFRLTLVWQTEALFPANYAVFLHLEDEAGELVAQNDSFPLQGIRPTTSWRPGEVLIDDHTLLLPPDLPPGDYMLWVGLYNPDTGERLPVTTVNGERPMDGRLLLGTVAVME
jgi:hypothetical protein